jgi:hypothetical protein
MADIAQVVVTGGTALVSAAAGAGLTYWLGALNRRHQEARENETRWYEDRLRAYVAFYQAVYEVFFRIGARARMKARLSDEETESLLQRILNDLGTIHFLGSAEVVSEAEKAFDAALNSVNKNYKSGDFSSDFLDELEQFRAICRIDLGHPESLSLLRSRGSKTKDPGS